MPRDSWIGLGRIALLLGVAWSTSLGAAAQDPDRRLDADAVKRDWDGLTPEQRENHRQRVIATIRYVDGRSIGTLAPLSPGDECRDTDLVELNVGDPPTSFAASGNTMGQTDFLSLTDDMGMLLDCSGVGPQFPGTGVGPDLIYRIRTDVTCALRVDLSPVLADLALYVLQDCRDPAGTCVVVNDSGLSGFPEVIAFTATAGQDYFVVVDGYMGAAGAFELTIERLNPEDTCSLPVELQNFTVE